MIVFCAETRNRIRLSVAAYAYEFQSDPIMSDAEYDRLSQAIDLTKVTNRPDLDLFFQKNFRPETGMWIRSHPELKKVKQMYLTLKRTEKLYDKLYNDDLFGPIKSRPEKPFEACQRCGGNIHAFPAQGGCYC